MNHEKRAAGNGVWPQVKLADLSGGREDAFADGPFGSHLKTEHYTPSGARIVRLQNIGRGQFLDADQAFISLDHFKQLERHAVQAGDIVIAALGDGARPAGRACIIPHNFGVGLVKADCFRVRLPRETVYAPFLVAYMNSPDALGWIADKMRGATRPRVNLGMIKECRIPLPPLQEQERIAGLVNEQIAAVERARAAAEQRLAAAEALAGAYLRDAFCGITPLSVDRRPPGPPTGWNWKTLTELAQLESGHTPSRRRPDWWGGEIPWIALPDIRELDGRVAFDTREHTNEAGIANSAARVLPAGTVVLSRTASVGFVTIMGRPMATSQDFVNWVCGSHLDPHFLAMILRASRSYILSLASGAVHKTVYMPTVQAFRVCAPPPDEQRRIVARVNRQLASAERMRKALEEQLGAMDALPAALLRRAFSGGQ